MRKAKSIGRSRFLRGNIAFTLIERNPAKAEGVLSEEGSDSANLPFRADSLIPCSTGNGAERGVTKSREGNLGLGLPGQRETRSQSERRGKCAGRRQTNYRKHRKECHDGHCWQSHGESSDEPLFYGRSLTRAGKQMGTRTCLARRCKRGRHAWKTPSIKTGETLTGPEKAVCR